MITIIMTSTWLVQNQHVIPNVIFRIRKALTGGLFFKFDFVVP